ncbi:2-dehydropantoate 2-reductase [Rheinheimera sp.]|uniref:2-dehydropantoate 2-reductase n=1 Tax=Rheinheimera sp. TaxID=1869214 RepID=UPI00307F8363
MQSANNHSSATKAAASAAALPHLVVLGAGSIGCYLGVLAAQSGLFQVSFIGRESLALDAAVYGFTAQNLELRCYPLNSPAVFTSLEALRGADLVLCTVKAVSLHSLLPELGRYLRSDAEIIALQNGVAMQSWYQQFLPLKVGRAIVPFNVVKAGPGLYARTSGGAMVWSAPAMTLQSRLMDALSATGLQSELQPNILAAELGKLLLNLNNAINALCGLPLRQQLLQRPYRLLLAGVMEELLTLCRYRKLSLHRYTQVPNAVLPTVLRLPDVLFRLLASSMLAINPEARSSMWDDLQAGRQTEIDYLNGAVVALAEEAGLTAPLNQALVSLVRQKQQGQPVSLTPQQALQLLAL